MSLYHIISVAHTTQPPTPHTTSHPPHNLPHTNSPLLSHTPPHTSSVPSLHTAASPLSSSTCSLLLEDAFLALMTSCTPRRTHSTIWSTAVSSSDVFWQDLGVELRTSSCRLCRRPSVCGVLVRNATMLLKGPRLHTEGQSIAPHGHTQTEKQTNFMK